MTSSYKIKLRLPHFTNRINWSLLMFLLLILDVKLVVKGIAIVLFILLNRRSLTLKHLAKRYIAFYAAMIVITIINTLIYYSALTVPYFVVVCTGIGFWIACGLSALIIFDFVQKTEIEQLHSTITAFFIVNALVSLGLLTWIMIDAGSVNPYTFQGFYQKYFISTGDRITGISFDTSTTNALLSAFGVVYFLMRYKPFMILLCMIVLVLTSSNFSNILLIGTLVYLFIFQTNRNQKTMIVVCFLIMVIFLVKISPQNNDNAMHIFQRIAGKKKPSLTTAKPVPLRERADSVLTPEEKKQKFATLYLDSVAKLREDEEEKKVALSDKGIGQKLSIPPGSRPSIPKASIHSPPYQMSTDTTAQQKRLLDYASVNIPDLDTNTQEVRARRVPGKVIAFEQTISFLNAHPMKLLMGTGTGRFASKLAFRVSGLQMAGGFPQKFVFIDSDFRNNHLALYITYFSKHKELHSLINAPNSLYDQLITEYGIVGIICFLLLYLAYFTQGIKGLTYGIPVLMIMLGAFAIDYWYEQLSITIVFELLMLVNMKEKERQIKETK